MPDTQVYHYQPTLNGFRYTSHSPDNPSRLIPAILYPDNRREMIFDADTLKELDRYPFRPIVSAMTAPRYKLDLHSVTFIAGRGATGLVMKIDGRDLPAGTEIYYLHGGMLGWNTHSPFNLKYQPNMCWGNALTLHSEYARIDMDERTCDVNFDGLTRVEYQPNWIAVNCMWKHTDRYKQHILVRAEGTTMQIAPRTH